MLNANDPKIERLMAALTHNDKQVGSLKSMHPNLHSHYAWHSKQRQKFIAIDCGSSGSLMVDRNTEQVYSIKGYGQPNYDKPRGTVEFLTEFVDACTDKDIGYRHGYWYALHCIDYICGTCLHPDTKPGHVETCENKKTFCFDAFDARSVQAAKIIKRSKTVA